MSGDRSFAAFRRAGRRPGHPACALVGLAACLAAACAEDLIINAGGIEIFDGGLFMDADIEIVNGKIVVKGAGNRNDEKPPEPDPAGDQVLELTDGSQLHGKLVALGRNEVVWQRADATQPLVFLPQEIRRLVLGRTLAPKDTKANATLKLAGSDWLAGEVRELKDGRFSIAMGDATKFDVERAKVEWLALSPVAPPDAYEGPIGPMGLAGWEVGPEPGGGWDYADGALVAKNASTIARTFDVLPEKVDIQFTAGDGGSSNRGLTLWLQPGTSKRGYTTGSCYLRFQANNVSANFYTGEDMKNLTANITDEKDDKKLTRYRLLFDRRDGRLIVQINGRQVADWDLPEIKEPSVNGSISWQPSYWSSNMAWTLSNVRVCPWDGYPVPDAKDDEAGKDLIKAAPTERKAGTFESMTADSVKFSGAEVSRKDAIFLRLVSPPAAEPPPGAVARVWLTTRGEFDASAIGFKDGLLKVRTAFAGDLTFPAKAVRAIEFPHKLAANVSEGGDTIIFKNGDQLRGTLTGASHDRPLQWKPVKGERPIEFASDRVAGVLLAPRGKQDPKPPSGNMAVRMHNGDWLPGELVSLDTERLLLKSAVAGPLQITRGSVRTLYFGAGAEAPVWDGASGREAWMKGSAVPGYWGESSTARRKDDKRLSPWRYLDGAFTLVGGQSQRGSNGGPNLGRSFDMLPDKVDVSFALSTAKGPASYAIQLFFDDNKPGLMIQGGWDSAYIYDMSPRRNAGVFINQPQQLDFGEKIGSEGNRRHFRFLSDRRTGHLWMLVNGRFVGSLGRRGGTAGESPKPGKGIAIVPTPMASRVTVSDLWIAPWSGALPAGASVTSKKSEDEDGGGKDPAPAANDKNTAKPAVDDKAATNSTGAPRSSGTPLSQDAVALVNGDETLGLVTGATGEGLKLKCDVGELDIPLARARLVDFAGAPPSAAKPGIRFRFIGKGAITVESFRIEGDNVVCRSAAAGDVTFPLSVVAEIVYAPDTARPFAAAVGKEEAPPVIRAGLFEDRLMRP